MKRFKSMVLVALALFVTTAIALPGSSASAQSASSASLSITPKKTYEIKAGASVNDKLTIRNLDANGSLELNLSVIDFTYTDDSGTPKLLLDQNAEPTTWSLKSYLSVPKTVTVAPGASKSVDLGVRMPTNLGAGSYYSAILYSTGAPDGGNVGLSASGVTLVFVTVPGTVSESLTLKNFGPYDTTAKKFNSVLGDEPKTIAYTLENKGNVTEAPVGTIILKDLLAMNIQSTMLTPVSLWP